MDCPPVPQVPVELLWNPLNAALCYNASALTEEGEITLQGQVNLLRCKEGEQLSELESHRFENDYTLKCQ